MQTIPTKQLIDEYIDSEFGQDEITLYKVRGGIDRKEIYEYEAKIGKQLMDFTEDEIIDMVCTLQNGRVTSRGEGVSLLTYKNFLSRLRGIFNYYIEHYEVIRNPMNSKSMRGAAALDKISERVIKPYSYEDVEQLIAYAHMDDTPEMGDWLECVILLFYSGCPSPQELTRIKEDMIDFNANEIHMANGVTIHPSARCLYLFKKVHEMEIVMGGKGRGVGQYLMYQYKDYYMRYLIVPGMEYEYNQREEEVLSELANKINQQFAKRLSSKYNVKASPRQIYLLGFYDYMVNNLGLDETNDIILSQRDKSKSDIFVSMADQYGVNRCNITEMRNKMRPFVRH